MILLKQFALVKKKSKSFKIIYKVAKNTWTQVVNVIYNIFGLLYTIQFTKNKSTVKELSIQA